jgi:hypothetical protein
MDGSERPLFGSEDEGGKVATLAPGASAGEHAEGDGGIGAALSLSKRPILISYHSLRSGTMSPFSFPTIFDVPACTHVTTY